MPLNKYIDHTLLKPTATPADIKKLCQEAKKHSFAAVCIHPCYLEYAKEILKDTPVKVAVVIGFPLGAITPEAKVFEAKDAIKKGADEIDMVINIGMLKAGETTYVTREITEIKKAVGDKILKVILETCYLNEEEKKTASRAALEAKADYIKTSTGFGSGGATFADVNLMKDIAGNQMKIKASGGIKDRETAMKYIELGASRLGTSSGIELITLETN